MSDYSQTPPEAPTYPDVAPIRSYVADLPEKLLPWKRRDHRGRLIFIGDVHGHLWALQRLLSTIEYDKDKGDHLIFTGDMIRKGPNSGGVIDLAIREGATAVRGNHEDHVLAAHDAVQDWQRKEMKNAAASRRRPYLSSSRRLPRGTLREQAAQSGHLVSTSAHDDGSGDSDAGSRVSSSSDEDGGVPIFTPEGSPPLASAMAELTLELPRDPAAYLDEYCPPGHKRWDCAMARCLTSAQMEWLRELPIVVRISLDRNDAEDGDEDDASLPPTQNNSSKSSSDKSSSSSSCSSSASPQHQPWADASTVYVVHAGLVPTVPLAEQSPWAVMNMRTLVHPGSPAYYDYLGPGAARPAAGRAGPLTPPRPTSQREGEPWSEVWDAEQAHRRAGGRPAAAVVYGHDSRRGLNAGAEVLDARGLATGARKGARERFAFGLDSGAVAGGRLSALVLEVEGGGGGGDSEGIGAVVGGGGGGGTRRIVHKIVQVDCPAANVEKDR